MKKPASWAHRDKRAPAFHCGFSKLEAVLTCSRTRPISPRFSPAPHSMSSPAEGDGRHSAELL